MSVPLVERGAAGPRRLGRVHVGVFLLALPVGFGIAAACTVPELSELGAKGCDPDAGHACIAGFVCIEGVCRVPSGGACIEGASRACGSDAGLCRPGSQRCDGGSWGACLGGVAPAAERCDGEDNDCDGARDEDATDTPPCAEQRGVCAGTRALCVGGEPEPLCSTAAYGPRYEASEASCDLLDNDCDGTVDQRPGGGALRGVACELDAGVCQGAFRACVDGGFEAPCGVASYGVAYEPHELRCDGIDNDCDGAIDRGREVALVQSANAVSTHPSIVRLGDALALSYLDERGGVVRAFARVYAGALEPGGAELALSDATATSARVPSLAPLAAQRPDGGLVDSAAAFVALWIETVAGVDRLRVARVELEGGQLRLEWARTVADDVVALREPRLATGARDGGSKLVAVTWIDGTSQRLQGSVWSAAGELRRESNPIAASDPDAGVELVFDVDVTRVVGPASEQAFVLGWIAVSQGQWSVRFRALGEDLSALGPRRELPADGGTPAYLRLAAWSQSSTGAAWIETKGDAKVVRVLHDVLGGLVSPDVVASASGASVQVVELAAAAAESGIHLAWIERTVGSARLRLHRASGSGSPSDLTPSAASAIGAPTLLPWPGGAVTVAYESDRGAGLDLFAQSVCSD